MEAEFVEDASVAVAGALPATGALVAAADGSAVTVCGAAQKLANHPTTLLWSEDEVQESEQGSAVDRRLVVDCWVQRHDAMVERAPP